MNLPRKLHIGCGTKRLEGCINVDIDPKLDPDLVHDFNHPFPPEGPTTIKHFGEVAIPKGHFDEIYCHHVLEHIRELMVAVRSCFDALRDGGTLHVTVPYELSLGAWSDPTHVRAFNERSWLYFTDWCGWTDGRFDLVKHQFVLGPYGQELSQKGTPLASIVRHPRAVEELRAVLRKRLYGATDTPAAEASGSSPRTE